MDTNNYYLLFIIVLLIALAAVLFVWLRRDRSLPGADREAPTVAPAADPEPDLRVTAAEALADPIVAVPPEAIGVAATRSTPPPAEPSFAPAPARAEVAPADAGPPDTLTTLKGLGPKAAARLNELGITRYDQLAALSDPELSRIDAQMGAFQGRILRDRWVEQAGHLASGDTAGFEAKFGKLGG
jgi:predicted flap endonuclease-1-like 5' DNA nuclease